MTPMRIILDTDIGTDVDDLIALALILGSPEVRIEALTCVYGDVLLRARCALKLFKLRGVEPPPVLLGASRPLLGVQPIYWEGHEGEGLLEAGDEHLQPDPEHAVDAIIRIVMANPGRIHLACIGPLTNIAQALLREPRLAEAVAGLTIMGGVLRGPERLDLPYAEHNMRCDPEAAHIVFTSGAPIRLLPLDITTRVRIRPEDVAQIRAAGTPYHAMVADQIERYPRYQRQGHTNLHDPLAVASLLQPDLLTWTPALIDVELNSRFAAGATFMRAPAEGETTAIEVAVGVDAARFEAFAAERLRA